jgi:hypothetical protein
MGHPLRWYKPDVVYEVTTRTIQERFLLRPSVEARELINGVIARALLFYTTVQVYAFVFLSNHYHMLVSAKDAAELADFFCYVNGNISRELGRLHGWRGSLWARAVRPIPILDEAAQIERFRYLLANGVKEGLVASPRDWPGATTVPALLGSMKLTGTWIDRDGLRRARRTNPSLSADAFTSHPEVELSPLPAWRDLTAEQLRAKHEEIVADIEREAAERDRPVLGVAAILAQDPHDAPEESARKPAPLCHTTSPVLREGYRRGYAAFVQAFRDAAAKAAKAVAFVREHGFPTGSFPRPRWFHRHEGPPVLPAMMVDLALDQCLRASPA